MSHQRLLVTFDRYNNPKEEAAGKEAYNSQSARRHVYSTLLQEGFTGEGFWNKAPADYFVVGNVFCGELLDPVALKLLSTRQGRCDNYDFGCDIDAQIITEEIWERLIKPYIGKPLNHEELVDISVWDFVTDKEEMVGKKWIVVVDYK